MYQVKDGEFENWYADLLDRLRAEQEMQGLTTTALASLAGVSTSGAREVMAWMKRPNIETLFRLMAALEVDFARVTKDYGESENK